MPSEKRDGGDCGGSGGYGDSVDVAGGVAEDCDGGIAEGPQIIGMSWDFKERWRGSGPKLYRPRNPSSALSVL